jgi:hypothetical protein
MGGSSENELVATVRQAVVLFLVGSPHARAVMAELGDGEDVRATVERLLAERCEQARREGWNDDDLRQLERRTRLPADANELEHQVAFLGQLVFLQPVPNVATPAPEDVDAGMLAKIRALLAKAESTTFPHEAEALTAKAQELLGRHRIDEAALDQGRAHGPGGRRIWLDDPYASAKFSLLSAVARANRCTAVRLGKVGACHVVGFPSDLEVVEVLHTSLLVQATTAMAAAGRQVDDDGRSRTRSFRQSFLVGFAARIGQRLREASATGEAEGVAAHGPSVLPVLARRDQEVEAAVSQAFPRLRTSHTASSNRAGLVAGVTAADRADLSVRRRVEGRSRTVGVLP